MPRTKEIKYKAFKEHSRCFSYGYGQDLVELRERLDAISKDKKVFVELCAGYSEYSLEYLRNAEFTKNILINDGNNIPNDTISIAVDIKEDRLMSALKIAEKEGLDNFYCLRVSIAHIAELLKNFADIVFLVHPDPQLESKRKRLNQPVFIDIYNTILKPQGSFTLVTDNVVFFDEFLDNNKFEIKYQTFLGESEGPFDIIKTRYNTKFINFDNQTKILTFEKQ